MNTQGLPARSGRVVSLLVLALHLCACAGLLLGGGSNAGRPLGADTRSSSQVAADNAVSARVRERLGGDALLGPYALQVNTVNGRVTLNGTVGSYAARDQAVRLAYEVEGVSKVDNRLRVNTAGDEY